jgi:hypothetical protein
MAANAPEVQVIFDNGQTARVKVTAYFTGATTSNTTIVRANTLAFANTSKSSNVCSLSISQVQFASDLAGFAQLYWAGASANTPIYNFGTSHAGTLDAYVQNNATGPTGELGLWINAAANLDTLDLIITINKEAGYANAFIEYNDNRYVGG